MKKFLISFVLFLTLPVFAADTLGQESTDSNVKELYSKALALYSDNSTEEVLEAFKQIPEYARSSSVWMLMGNTLLDVGKKRDAILMYNRAIAVDKDNYRAHYNLGNVYLEDDMYNRAIDCYKEANRANMTFPYAYYNLGIAYVKSGDLKKAKTAFLRALEYKKDEPDFHYNLAFVYKQLGKTKLAETYINNYNQLMER